MKKVGLSHTLSTLAGSLGVIFFILSWLQNMQIGLEKTIRFFIFGDERIFFHEWAIDSVLVLLIAVWLKVTEIYYLNKKFISTNYGKN